MRTFITIIIALVSFTMISCSDNCEPFEAVTTTSDDGTRTCFSDSAYVRIGMFGNVAGYSIKVENMKVMSATPSVQLPDFGSAITTAESLPATAGQALFDTQNGSYHGVTPTTNADMIIVEFDVVLNGNDADDSQRFESVKCYITPDNATWAEGMHYEYLINVDEDLLQLSSIDFQVNVGDYNN